MGCQSVKLGCNQEIDSRVMKKVKVKVLQSFGGGDYHLTKDEIVEVHEEIAADWIKHGLAEKVK